jgi:hypothetical protein
MEQDSEYLAQMVLRDAISQSTGKHNPCIQAKALQVARRLGTLQAIYAYFTARTQGARAEDVCSATAGVETVGDGTAWLLMLAIFCIGALFGCLVHKFCFTAHPPRARKRNVATQSQTTYTSLRGVEQPRFHPLPDQAHGASVDEANHD